MSEAWAESEKFEQSLVEQGIEKGIGRGHQDSLAFIYEDRLGPMPAAVREALGKITDAARG